MRTVDNNYERGSDKKNHETDHFLDDEGKVHPGRVRAADHFKFDADVCDELREEIDERSISAAALADERGYGESAVGEHVRGDCVHDNDVPPVTYDASERQWSFPDEVDS